MLSFTVDGPFEVPFYQGNAAKAISSEEARGFWELNPKYEKRRGCYIFAIRAGGGITPIYVGKATRGFKSEVFTADKLAKYQRGLADYLKGSPVLFFLLHPAAKGKPNKALIGELEDFLIQTAISRNSELINVQGTKKAEFNITGVLRSGVGKPSNPARSLKSCLGL